MAGMAARRAADTAAANLGTVQKRIEGTKAERAERAAEMDAHRQARVAAIIARSQGQDAGEEAQVATPDRFHSSFWDARTVTLVAIAAGALLVTLGVALLVAPVALGVIGAAAATAAQTATLAAGATLVGVGGVTLIGGIVYGCVSLHRKRTEENNAKTEDQWQRFMLGRAAAPIRDGEAAPLADDADRADRLSAHRERFDRNRRLEAELEVAPQPAPRELTPEEQAAKEARMKAADISATYGLDRSNKPEVEAGIPLEEQLEARKAEYVQARQEFNVAQAEGASFTDGWFGDSKLVKVLRAQNKMVQAEVKISHVLAAIKQRDDAAQAAIEEAEAARAHSVELRRLEAAAAAEARPDAIPLDLNGNVVGRAPAVRADRNPWAEVVAEPVRPVVNDEELQKLIDKETKYFNDIDAVEARTGQPLLVHGSKTKLQRDEYLFCPKQFKSQEVKAIWEHRLAGVSRRPIQIARRVEETQQFRVNRARQALSKNNTAKLAATLQQEEARLAVVQRMVVESQQKYHTSLRSALREYLLGIEGAEHQLDDLKALDVNDPQMAQKTYRIVERETFGEYCENPDLLNGLEEAPILQGMIAALKRNEAENAGIHDAVQENHFLTKPGAQREFINVVEQLRTLQGAAHAAQRGALLNRLANYVEVEGVEYDEMPQPAPAVAAPVVDAPAPPQAQPQPAPVQPEQRPVNPEVEQLNVRKAQLEDLLLEVSAEERAITDRIGEDEPTAEQQLRLKSLSNNKKLYQAELATISRREFQITLDARRTHVVHREGEDNRSPQLKEVIGLRAHTKHLRDELAADKQLLNSLNNVLWDNKDNVEDLSAVAKVIVPQVQALQESMRLKEQGLKASKKALVKAEMALVEPKASNLGIPLNTVERFAKMSDKKLKDAVKALKPAFANGMVSAEYAAAKLVLKTREKY